MFDILMRLVRHYSLALIRLPVSLWINYQWAEMRYRETSHLLRLDDYLLKDMGLRKVGGRIEAIDPSRIDPHPGIFGSSSAEPCRRKRYRHAN